MSQHGSRLDRRQRRCPCLSLHGANFPVPTGPGLGIEVDEKVLRREIFRYAAMPKLTRRDGSITNR
jgi:hypothetical protein